MSTTGYGLWVDTTGKATFDMNASDRDEIVVDVTAAKLRIVLIAGPEFPGILERFTALAGRAVVPTSWAFAPWKAKDYHQNAAQVAEDVGPDAGAGAAPKRDPDRLAMEDDLQRLQVRSEAVRRRAGDGEAHSR